MSNITPQSLSPQPDPNYPTPKHPTHLFRALSSRNYRLFWFGQVISLLGTWIQQTAMSWLLYKLTNSALLLGVIAFLGQAPGFFIAPFAGTFADRLNRHKILIVTQSLAMLQAFILAGLTLSGHVRVEHLMILGMCLGIVTGLETPVRQAFVVDLLERPEDLSNAISLNSSAMNGARLIGPAIAGLAVATVGEGWCFLLNAISYIAVIIALFSMRLQLKRTPTPAGGYLHSIKEGFLYAYRFEPIRLLLFMVALLSLVGLPYSVIMPVYARDVLHGGPQALGYLLGSAGAGALLGALWLAARQNIIGLGRWIPVAALIFGFGLIGFALCRILWLSYLLLFGVGFGMIMLLASCNIILQSLADDDKRGRVMSLYTMAFLGMSPFGSLLIGFLATRIGVSDTLMMGGTIAILAGLYFAIRLPMMRELVRPVYIQKGILNEH